MAFWAIDAGRGVLPLLSVEIDVTNAPTNPTRVWTDVTNDVRSLTYSRAGRQDELQRTQPGSLSMTLNSKSAKYDPTNPSGIGIRRTQWLRVRAQWNGVTYARWQGLIENISQSWPQAGKVTSVVTITAADAMKVLTLFDLKGRTFPAQTTDARVSAICAAAGVSASIDDAGQSTLIPVTAALPKQSYADQHLQQVEQTENGLVFAGPEGAIHFQSRHYRTLHSQTAKATIGDTSGAILYRDSATVDTDDAYLVNLVGVTPTNADGSLGTDQVASDATSETNHFQRTSSTVDRTILVSSWVEALACAQWLVNRYGEPSPRVPTVEIIGSQLGRRGTAGLEGTTNLVSNGGFETNTNGWAAANDSVVWPGATVAQDATTSKFGAFSGAVTTDGTQAGGEGIRFSLSALTNGQTYTASAWFKGTSGRSYALAFGDQGGGAFVNRSIFTATGNWQRVTNTWVASANPAYVWLVESGHSVAQTFHVDGVQIEQKPYATPYVETNGAVASRPDEPAAWAAVLAANNSDRLTFQRSAAGNTIQQDCFIEKITETIVPNTSWDISLQLSPADTALFWDAQVAGYGEAGVHTYAAY